MRAAWSDQSVEAIAARVRAASPAHLARGAGVGRPAAYKGSVITATSSAISRLHLGWISAVSRLYLGYISAASRLHLACKWSVISATSSAAF